MKRLFVLTICIVFGNFLFAQNNNDEVLMTIAGEDITKSEFLRVYNKNNVDNIVDKKSIEEYLDLYINFKLKVKEAESLKIDTSQSFIKELDGYRKQLAKPYLIDNDLLEQMTKIVYERERFDVRASKILIKLPKFPSPKDTLIAYNKAIDLRNKLLKGADFKKIAIEFSETPTAKDIPATDKKPFRKGDYGDMGYLNVFNSAYQIEDALYSMKVNEISMPVRTNLGYEVLKLDEKRDALGVANAVHIYFRIPYGATKEDSLKKRDLAFQIYDSLMAGKDFAEMAKKYSDDKGTAASGGTLPPLGVNRIIPEFIEQLYDLKPGDISKPFHSFWGWHIVKLINVNKKGSYEQEKDRLRGNIIKDARYQLVKKSALNKIKKTYNLSIVKESLNDFYKVIDSSIFKKKWQLEKANGLNKIMFTLGKSEFKQDEFAKYLFDHQTMYVYENEPISMYVDKKFDEFIEETCFDYADKHLEDGFEDFRNLIKEYRDGMLLFEITDRNVWTKASADTLGLQKFYESNKSKYMWGKRLDAEIYTALNEKTAKKAQTLVKKGTNKEEILKTLNPEGQTELTIETKKYSKGDNPTIDGIEWKSGMTTITKINDKFVFVNVKNVCEPQPKLLSEVKGLITADYQDYLMEQWIKELRAKYTFSVNKSVLESIKK